MDPSLAATLTALHPLGVALHFALAVITVLLLTQVRAPYGRFARSGWGPTVPGRVGWMVMESPAVLLFLVVFLAAPGTPGVAGWLLMGLWMLHYAHRTFIFPLRLRSTRPMPILVPALAFTYQCLNAPLGAWQISAMRPYDATWLSDPRFLLGAALMLAGIVANIHADTVLINLRRPGETGYRIPRGGLFRWVTAGNYLGELGIWFGWALATWSLAGLAFALYTTANLAPRAADAHRWYHAHFGADYPPERRRLLPGLW